MKKHLDQNVVDIKEETIIMVTDKIQQLLNKYCI